MEQSHWRLAKNIHDSNGPTNVQIPQGSAINIDSQSKRNKQHPTQSSQQIHNQIVSLASNPSAMAAAAAAVLAAANKPSDPNLTHLNNLKLAGNHALANGSNSSNSSNNFALNQIHSSLMKDFGGNLDNLLLDASQQVQQMNSLNNKKNFGGHNLQQVPNNNIMNGQLFTGANNNLSNPITVNSSTQSLESMLRKPSQPTKSSLSQNLATTFCSPYPSSAFNSSSKNDRGNSQQSQSMLSFQAGQNVNSNPDTQASSFPLPTSLLNLAACTSTTPNNPQSINLNNNNAISSAILKKSLKTDPNSRMQMNNDRLLPSGFKKQNLSKQHQNSILAFSNDISQRSSNINLEQSDNSNKVGNINQRNLPVSSLNEMGQYQNTRSSQLPQNLNHSSRSSSKSVSIFYNEEQNQPAFTKAKQSGSKLIPASISPSLLSSLPSEAYLADFQERAARNGLSIDMIKNNDFANQPALSKSLNQSSKQQNNLSILEQNLRNSIEDRRDIESALSSLAREDLSLLYPPVDISTSSKEQIDSLATGLTCVDSDKLTDEVKNLVLKETRIIYECKKCTNLFRSIPSLIEHKRIYCFDKFDRNLNETVRRPSTGLFPTVDKNTNKNCTKNTMQGGNCRKNSSQLDLNTVVVESNYEDIRPVVNYDMNITGGLQGYNLEDELNMTRSSRKRISQQNDVEKLKDQPTMGTSLLSNLLKTNDTSNKASNFEKQALSNSGNTSLNSILESKSHYINHKTSRNVVDECSTILESPRHTSNVDISSQSISKCQLTRGPTRTTTKRKALEECIEKVKRDKLMTDESINLTTNDDQVNIVTDNLEEQLSEEDQDLDSMKEKADNSSQEEENVNAESISSPASTSSTSSSSCSSSSRSSTDSSSSSPSSSSSSSSESGCEDRKNRDKLPAFRSDVDESKSTVVASRPSSIKSSSSNRTPPVQSGSLNDKTTPSTSGVGGIKKLKIQLKAKSDTVYEIVETESEN